jgi:hypothetical protein
MVIVACVWAVAISSDAALRSAMPEVPTVFITETGVKYHRHSCRHLKRSREELTLDEARQRGYEPCGVCKPPK